MKPMLLAALIALCGNLALPSIAFAYCSEPSAPYCATGYGAFSDEYQFNSCKREMESFASEADDYISCRADEATQIAQDAADDAKRDADSIINSYNDAVASFNRRANQ